jgi:polysaccharide export outer membrane protein
VTLGLVGRNDFSVPRAQVSSEGIVLLPLVGRVKAVGLTTAQLAQAVQERLIKGGFYSDPLVHVEVVGVASRYATILGDVGNPGLLPLDRAYRLSEIVARVGARGGDGPGTIVLTRPDGKSTKYSLEEIATGAGPGDPIVQPGDKIYVPSARVEAFYISGQVKSPGSFPVTKGMTVREAIARGGGLTEMGSENKLKLYRDNVLVKGVKLDTVLQPGDILQIGERLF